MGKFIDIVALNNVRHIINIDHIVMMAQWEGGVLLILAPLVQESKYSRTEPLKIRISHEQAEQIVALLKPAKIY